MAQEQGETLPSRQACPTRCHQVIGQEPREEEKHAACHAVQPLHDYRGDLRPEAAQEPQQENEP
jgi:hypothetical protein